MGGQLQALLDEPRSCVTCCDRSLQYLVGQLTAGIKVRADTLGQIRLAVRAEMTLVPEKV